VRQKSPILSQFFSGGSIKKKSQTSAAGLTEPSSALLSGHGDGGVADLDSECFAVADASRVGNLNFPMSEFFK
jgi:hypothetical protein